MNYTFSGMATTTMTIRKYNFYEQTLNIERKVWKKVFVCSAHATQNTFQYEMST